MVRRKTLFRLSVIALLVITVSVAASGCSKQTVEEQPQQGVEAPKPSAEAPKPSGEQAKKVYTISSAAVGGGWYPVSAGISLVTNSLIGEFLVNAVPGPGGTGNPSRVAKGEADFGISYNIFLKMAKDGTGAYNEAFGTDLRGVCSLTMNVFHVLADKAIQADSIDDAIAKKTPMKAAIAPAGDSGHFAFVSVLEEFGVTFDDIKSWGGQVMTGGTASRSEWWSDRGCNVFTSMLQIPASAVNEALFSRPGKFLGIKDETRQALASKWGFELVDIPANTYKSQSQTIGSIGATCVLFAHKSVPDDIVYAMTKAIAENKKYLAGVHSSFDGFEPAEMGKGLGIELHPGAAKYYAEKGYKTS